LGELIGLFSRVFSPQESAPFVSLEEREELELWQPFPSLFLSISPFPFHSLKWFISLVRVPYPHHSLLGLHQCLRLYSRPLPYQYLSCRTSQGLDSSDAAALFVPVNDPSSRTGPKS
jgi:hypothetical protein